MAELSDLQDAVDALVTGPQSASNQMGSASMPSISEAIKGEQHKANRDALDQTNEAGYPASGWALLRPARGIPPGGRG